MTLVEKYLDRLNAGDVEGVVNCWTPDGIFDDESGKMITGQAYYLQGPDQLRVLFGQMCAFGAKGTILTTNEDGTVDYDIDMMGRVLRCRGTVVEEEDGKFKNFKCRTR